jgi:hypothetical protein
LFPWNKVGQLFRSIVFRINPFSLYSCHIHLSMCPDKGGDTLVSLQHKFFRRSGKYILSLSLSPSQ